MLYIFYMDSMSTRFHRLLTSAFLKLTSTFPREDWCQSTSLFIGDNTRCLRVVAGLIIAYQSYRLTFYSVCI
jgi:hypothetical protein